MLAEPQARRCWRTPGPYLGGGLLPDPSGAASLVGDRESLHHAEHIQRVARPTTGLRETGWFTLRVFGGGELGHIGLALCSEFLALQGRWAATGRSRWPGPHAFDRRFVAAMVFGPILLLLVVSVLARNRAPRPLGLCHVVLSGPVCRRPPGPEADEGAIRRLRRAWAEVFIATAVAYAAINSVASFLQSRRARHRPAAHCPIHDAPLQKEADFPGRESPPRDGTLA